MNRYVTQSLRVFRKEKQMNVELSNASRRMRRPALVAAAALVISAGLAVIETVVPTPVHALTNNLTTANLQVRDATTGDPIAEFKYIINVDNTGTTEQRVPGRRLLARGRRLSRLVQLDVDGRRQLEPDSHPG